jgi:hypothetical protein
MGFGYGLCPWMAKTEANILMQQCGARCVGMSYRVQAADLKQPENNAAIAPDA